MYIAIRKTWYYLFCLPIFTLGLASLSACHKRSPEKSTVTKWQYALTDLKSFTNSLTKNPTSKIVDMRSKSQYILGHVKGAIHLPLLTLTDSKFYPRPTSELSQILSKKGIRLTDKIILIDDKGILSAARIFWIFSYLGMENLKIFTGKLKALSAAGLLKDTTEKNYPSSKFIPNINSNVIATKDILYLSLYDKSKPVMDVRAHTTQDKLVRIQGTENRAWTFGRDPHVATYIESDADKKTIESNFKGFRDGSITFCFRGRHSSYVFFVGKNLGKTTSHFPGGINELLSDKRFTRSEMK